jgi:hypothetical protein
VVQPSRQPARSVPMRTLAARGSPTQQSAARRRAAGPSAFPQRWHCWCTWRRPTRCSGSTCCPS